MNKKIVISLLMSLMLLIPADAQAYSHSGRSSSSSSSRSYSSSSSSSSKVSLSKSSNSFKSSTKTLKSKTKTTIPRVGKKIVKKSDSNVTKKSAIKADSASFTTKAKSKSTTTSAVKSVKSTKSYTIKPRPKTYTKIKTTHVTYYTHYDNNRYYPANNDFLTYYMLGSMFNNNHNVTERDIARELENRGYSNSEVDKILNEGRKKKTNWWTYVAVITVSGGIIYIFIKTKK